MESIGLWLSPLLLIPGIGMLVSSTSARFSQIHNEIHHLMNNQNEHTEEILNHLFKRSKMFRNALICLYCAIGILVVSGLIGGIMSAYEADKTWIIILTCAGIIFLFVATVILILESFLSLKIIEEHVKDF